MNLTLLWRVHVSHSYNNAHRSNSFVENGTLFINPTLTADKLGAEQVSGAIPTTLELWG